MNDAQIAGNAVEADGRDDVALVRRGEAVLASVEEIDLLDELGLAADVEMVRSRADASLHHGQTVLPVGPDRVDDELGALGHLQQAVVIVHVRLDQLDGAGPEDDSLLAQLVNGTRDDLFELRQGPSRRTYLRTHPGLGTRPHELQQDVVAREAGGSEDHDVQFPLFRHVCATTFLTITARVLARRLWLARFPISPSSSLCSQTNLIEEYRAALAGERGPRADRDPDHRITMVDLRRVRVKLVSRNDTFVALPREGADEFHGRGIKGPIPLELVELQPPCRRHLVAFAGQASTTANCIELSRQYAQCLGIRDGAMVRVHESLRDLPVATRVVVAPVTEGDYAAVSISAKAAENGDVLSQVALVSIGLSFPLWVDRNKQLVMFTVKDLEFPKGAKHSSGMIRTGSELVVVQPQQQNGRPRGAKVNGKPKSQLPQSMPPPGRKITEARLVCLSPEIAADLGLDRAILDWEAASESGGDGDYGLWDISRGYAGPGVVSRLLASGGARGSCDDGAPPSSSSSEPETESVLVKVVPKVLEAAAGGEGRIGGPLGAMSPVCITLVTSNQVPKGHLALPPPLAQALGVEDKHRVVLVAVDCASQSTRDLATFNMEVSQIVDTSAAQATTAEEDREDDVLAKWGADAGTCEKMVNALIGTMNDATTAAVVLSKGTIFEVFHRKTRSSLRFLVTAISSTNPEDKLGDLGGMPHAFIGALAAGKGGVDAELTMGQAITAAAKTKTHPSSVGPKTNRQQGTHESLRSLESPWLAESRDTCVRWLQMALDEGLSAHFLRLGIDFPGGVLVHGATGSGKTVLCESVCAHFSEDLKNFATKIVWLDCEDFVSIEPEKMKRKLRVGVSRAAECQPSLVVIENVDIFASQGADAGAGQAVMESFQNAVFAETLCDLMDALREERHRVAFLATCRSLEGTHKSVKQSGCFDTHFAMPVPSRKQKAEIFGNLARAKNLSFVSEDEALDYLSRNCDGLDVAGKSNSRKLVGKLGTTGKTNFSRWQTSPAFLSSPCTPAW